MAVNNVCNTLIVYGSYVPGAPNHGVFSSLPGVWTRGKIVCDLINPPDGIAAGASLELEAWTIQFADCQAEFYSAEYAVQRRLLHDRWTSLDRAMGDQWARSQTRWWPDDGEPLVGKNGMIVVNIYVPLKNYPYLSDQEDVPSPDEEEDLRRLWTQVKKGEKKYEWSLFIGLIKDFTPEHYEELFGDLPRGSEFVGKLGRFYAEHRKGKGNLLWDGESERFSLYVVPLERNALQQDDLIDLAKADIANRAALLRAFSRANEAESLESLRFAFSTVKPVAQPDTESTAAALDGAADILSDSCNFQHRWMYCLYEACYGIAASFELRHWLMSQWYDVAFDFEPAYRLWKANGTYEVIGDTCYVFRQSADGA